MQFAAKARNKYNYKKILGSFLVILISNLESCNHVVVVRRHEQRCSLHLESKLESELMIYRHRGFTVFIFSQVITAQTIFT